MFAIQLQELASHDFHRLIVAGDTNGWLRGANRVNNNLQYFHVSVAPMERVQQESIIVDFSMISLFSSLEIASLLFGSRR